jgi:hypothetical protein
MAETAFKLPRQNIVFAAAGGWDAAGAKALRAGKYLSGGNPDRYPASGQTHRVWYDHVEF